MRAINLKTVLITLVVALTLAGTALASFTFKAVKIDKDYMLYMKCKDGRTMRAVLRANTASNVTVKAPGPCTILYNKGGIHTGNVKALKGGERITVRKAYLTRL